jgi:site-specific DNA recombinase
MNTHRPREPRAVIYTRVSTLRQEDGSSLETQAERCRVYASDHGYVTSAVFTDVHSGGDLFVRPGLRQLREAVTRNEVDVVIVYALDRLTRDQTHLGVLINLIEESGARLELVTEKFDDTPTGRFLRSAQAFAAEVERLKGKERSDRARAARLASGKPLVGPRPPYGYQWNADKTALALNPLTAPVARRIFAELLEGKSLRKVSEGLHADGIPTPTGKGLWVYTTITAIAANPVYAGELTALRFRHEKDAKGKKHQYRRPEEDTIARPGAAPAIISQEEFAAVRERLEYNKRWVRRTPKEPTDALLRGPFVRCGLCGSAMSVVRPKPGVFEYRCGRGGKYRHTERACSAQTIRTHLLDTAVWNHVVEVLRDPAVITERLEALRAEPPEAGVLAAIDRELLDSNAGSGILYARLQSLPMRTPRRRSRGNWPRLANSGRDWSPIARRSLHSRPTRKQAATALPTSQPGVKRWRPDSPTSAMRIDAPLSSRSMRG